MKKQFGVFALCAAVLCCSSVNNAFAIEYLSNDEYGYDDAAGCDAQRSYAQATTAECDGMFNGGLYDARSQTDCVSREAQAYDAVRNCEIREVVKTEAKKVGCGLLSGVAKKIAQAAGKCGEE